MSLQEWYSPQHQSKLWAVALRGGASFKGIWSLTLDTWLLTSSLATKVYVVHHLMCRARPLQAADGHVGRG